MELNMSNGHNFYMDMGENATVVHGIPDLAVGRNSVSGNDVFLEVSGRGTDHFTAVDANKLRDAIDKAVGRREGDRLFSDQASIYQEVALHEVFDDCWTPASTPSAADMIEKLDRLVAEKAVGEREEDQRISAWDTIVTHDFFRSCFDADGTLLDATLWKLDRLDANDYAADSWHEVKNHDFFDDCYDMDSIARHKILGKLDNLVKAERTGAKGSDPKPYRPIDRDRLLRHIEDVEAALARRNERWENDQARIRELEAGLARRNSRHERDQARIRELEAEVFTLREIKDSYEEPTADEKRRAEYEAQGLEGWEIKLLMEASMS